MGDGPIRLPNPPWPPCPPPAWSHPTRAAGYKTRTDKRPPTTPPAQVPTSPDHAGAASPAQWSPLVYFGGTTPTGRAGRGGIGEPSRGRAKHAPPRDDPVAQIDLTTTTLGRRWLIHSYQRRRPQASMPVKRAGHHVPSAHAPTCRRCLHNDAISAGPATRRLGARYARRGTTGRRC